MRLTSAFMFFQMYLSLTNIDVTLADGWDKLCVIRKTFSLNFFGMKGLGLPVLVSHDRRLPLILKCTQLRDILFSKDFNSSSFSWALAISLYEIPREIAERTSV